MISSDLNGQQFLQDIGCTVCFQRPNFHFTKTLTTELGFTAQWLLRDKAVWPDRTGVHLIVNHVVQLDDIDDTLPLLSGGNARRFRRHTIGMTRFIGQPCLAEPFAISSTEAPSKIGVAKLVTPSFSPAQPIRFRRSGPGSYAKVHPAGSVRYPPVFRLPGTACLRRANDLGNNTLVTVAACHLIPYFQLTLDGQVNLSQFQYACGKFITDRDIELSRACNGPVLRCT
jgi:hypothetical protein